MPAMPIHLQTRDASGEHGNTEKGPSHCAAMNVAGEIMGAGITNSGPTHTEAVFRNVVTDAVNVKHDWQHTPQDIPVLGAQDIGEVERAMQCIQAQVVLLERGHATTQV